MTQYCNKLRESGFDFQIEHVTNLIKSKGHSRILIQIPEGVKNFSLALALCVRERTGAHVTIFADPTWGACDIPVDEARRLGATLIVHYGHSEYSLQPEPLTLPPSMEIAYLPLPSNATLPGTVVEKLAEELALRGLRRPVITATIQHIKQLEQLVKALSRKGFKPYVHKTSKGMPGQVIGCDYRAGMPPVEHDSVVIVAGGVFHALGLALSTEKPVFQVDPYRLSVEELSSLRDRWLRKRYAVIYKALGARVWGVWLGTMTGQFRRALANKIEKLIEEKGGSWVEFYSRIVTLRELRAVDTPDIEAHVITSCPRVPTDDFTLEDYHKPVLSPGEAIMVLTGELDRYRFMW